MTRPTHHLSLAYKSAGTVPAISQNGASVARPGFRDRIPGTARGGLWKILALSLLLASGPGLVAQNILDEVEYEASDELQKAQIEYAERNIYEVSRKIERYYSFLQRMGLARDGELSRIPLQATMRTEWGKRERKIYNGTMQIEWNGGRIASIMFEERKGVAGSGHLLRKTWYIREIGKKEARTNAAGQNEDKIVFDGISMNIVIGEKADSLYTRYYNYRFFTGRDLRDNDRDIGLPEYAALKDSPVIPVREPNQRIKLLREYLDALRLLERRINYLAYTQLQGEDSLLNK
ncbi:MAG: hypothetical protein NXI24_11315 [bacterium]|nr:hypothetical protein [bacterium]